MHYVEVLVTSGKCSHEDIVKATEGALLLHQAVSSNRPKLVSRLIAVQECNVNDTNSAGETALHIACRTKNTEAIVQNLVEGSICDLNAQDQYGNTALHLAACSVSESAEKVQCILQSERCNPNITNSEGHTPLHFAVRNTDSQSAIILLKHPECNPNVQDLRGNTPLHMALTSNMGQTPVDVVEALTLHKSCNPSIVNNAGLTPLQISADLGKVDCTEVLISSEKYNPKDIKQAIENTHLHQAVSSRHIKLFSVLLRVPGCSETVLRIACKANCNKDIVQKLVDDSRCDLNAQDQHGNTALHLATGSVSESAEKVQCILQSERCNPNITNSEGHTPLHVAVRNTNFRSATILLEHPECNPNIQDLTGNTPLHIALTSNTSLPNVEPFLYHKSIDPNLQNTQGNTPLHEAVRRLTPISVVKTLTLHRSCSPNTVNNAGMTPLQVSLASGKLDYANVLIISRKCSNENILKAPESSLLLHQAVSSHNMELLTLLSNAGVNINMSNSDGETALHIACREGNIKATRFLLQGRTNILAVDKKGNAPIHLACTNMNFKCLGLLLGHHACNPNQQNAVGDTPLHILCSYGQDCDMKMLRTLLSTPGINPERVNHAGQIPAELAESNYSVIEMLSKYLEYKNTQLETYLKIFVVGNSGGGKSTLIKTVTTEGSKPFRNYFKAKDVNPSEVPPHTAGIVPLSFNSKHLGHAVLYDFAGQHEYYSSHAAVMENLVLPSPPLFLLLIDISKPVEEIREELVYWWMFINNHSKQATAPPHVILVGSHKDTVKKRGANVQRTMEQITDIVRDIPVSFQFDHCKAFPLDCRKLVSQGLTALLAQLKLTCQTLRQTADIDLHCHILKTFLNTNFHSSIACKVSEIAEKTNPEDDLLPQVPSQLIPLLSPLSDKGYILLLQNHTDVNKSLVVLKPEMLLAEVNGSIFAPDNFKEHCSGFAMSTGVVLLSKIIEKFGEPNNQVIIRYLTHLEFCFRIKDKHTLEMITKDETLQLTPHGHDRVEEYYFFPVLVQKKIPSDVCQPQEIIKYECGWFYRYNEPTEQLITRFLHVLILCLAFSCDSPDEPQRGSQ